MTNWIAKHLWAIFFVVMFVCLLLLGQAVREDVVEAPVAPVEMLSPEPKRTYPDDLERRLERVERLLERVEAYLAERE